MVLPIIRKLALTIGPLNDAPAVAPWHNGRTAHHLRLLLPLSAKTWMPTASSA
jgi:hypothetical protein